jgi:hypothetical protein
LRSGKIKSRNYIYSIYVLSRNRTDIVTSRESQKREIAVTFTKHLKSFNPFKLLQKDLNIIYF